MPVDRLVVPDAFQIIGVDEHGIRQNEMAIIGGVPAFPHGGNQLLKRGGDLLRLAGRQFVLEPAKDRLRNLVKAMLRLQ
ncbi:hypothetical protein D3C75_1253150 [compost metagenome]